LKTSTGPAAANFQTGPYVLFKGSDNDNSLYYITGFNMPKNDWGRGTPLGGNTGAAPAMTETEDNLMAVWKGEGEDNRIFYSIYTISRDWWWSEQLQLGNYETSSAPAVATFGSKVYAAWKGASSSMCYSVYDFDTNNWSGQQVVPNVATSAGPALASLGDKLYMAWKGESDEKLFYTSFDGNSWDGQKTIGGNTSNGVALAYFEPMLWAAWKGEEGDNRIYYSCFDGNTWQAQQHLTCAGGTSAVPAMCEGNILYTGLVLFFFWKGESDDQKIRWTGCQEGMIFSSDPA
jgi:hypothetical protein